MKGHINSSGFPLQIAVQYQVDEMTNRHGFRTLYSEHSWKNELTSESGFIDLILANKAETVFMIVECKRVKDTSWIFMKDERKALHRRHAKSFIFTKSHGTIKRYGWDDLMLSPETVESKFCIIPGTDNKSKSLIERCSAELVSSTEGFAQECSRLSQNNREILKVFFNVIITTATLQVCEYDPAKIKLSDGELLDANFKEVPYLRYRKQLSPLYEIPGIHQDSDSFDITRAKESTVFVVNSLHVHEFLSEFEIDSGHANDYYLR